MGVGQLVTFLLFSAVVTPATGSSLCRLMMFYFPMYALVMPSLFSPFRLFPTSVLPIPALFSGATQSADLPNHSLVKEYAPGREEPSFRWASSFVRLARRISSTALHLLL